MSWKSSACQNTSSGRVSILYSSTNCEKFYFNPRIGKVVASGCWWIKGSYCGFPCGETQVHLWSCVQLVASSQTEKNEWMKSDPVLQGPMRDDLLLGVISARLYCLFTFPFSSSRRLYLSLIDAWCLGHFLLNHFVWFTSSQFLFFSGFINTWFHVFWS